MANEIKQLLLKDNFVHASIIVAGLVSANSDLRAETVS
jgi:hypothetical protein